MLWFDLFYNKVLGNNIFCYLVAKLLMYTIKVYAYCSDFLLLHFVIPTSFQASVTQQLFVLERNRRESSYQHHSTERQECGLWWKHTERPFHRDGGNANGFFMAPWLPKYTETHQLISYCVVCRPSVVCQIWFSWLCSHNVKYMCFSRIK